MKRLILPLFILSMNVQAATLFTDDFEGNLSQWTTTGSAQIVADPLQADNALNFTAVTLGGDTFTSSTIAGTVAGDSYILDFDYLGTCTDGNCGGFIGYSQAQPGNHVWLAGTFPQYISGGFKSNVLDDNNTWQHYTINFTSLYDDFNLMLEDFSFSGTEPLDAYFDNIVLTDANGPSAIPEPSIIALFGLGLVGLGFARRRMRS